MIRTPYEYDIGYIRLPINTAVFALFPTTITWEGTALSKKSEFHATICKSDDIYSLSSCSATEGEKHLVELFNEFVDRQPIRLNMFIHDFRAAHKEEKRSILVRCELTNLDGFFNQLNHSFRIEMPRQPAHVTLYSLPENVGIHIPSDEVMANLQKVDLPELHEAFRTLPV